MIVWFWTNVSLTTLALAFASLNAKSPHRLRFLVCFAALGSWMIPWGQIAPLVPTPSAISDVLLNGFEFDVGQGHSPSSGDSGAGGWMAAIVVNAGTVLLALTLVGALQFAFSSLRYVQFVRRMSRGSVEASHLWADLPWETVGSNVSRKRPELRIQRHVPGAMTTGVLVPTIWVHEDIVEHPGLRAALVHEYLHVRHLDNAYLWVITLIEKLFWWNPLVRYLSLRTRRLQELSCDEACAKELAGYRDMLNRLILSSSNATGKPCPQMSSIRHSKSFNVQRLRALERRYAMRTRHYISTGLLLIGSSISLSWALAQDTSDEQASAADCPPLSASTPIEERLEAIEECTGQDLGPIAGFDPGTTLEDAERLYRDMKLYARLIEVQFARQEQVIESLEQELETLQ